MRIVIAVLIGLVSAIVGTWFAFFNPGIGVVMSVSIIGAAIIYLLSKGKDRLFWKPFYARKIILYIQSTQQLRSHLELKVF